MLTLIFQYKVESLLTQTILPQHAPYHNDFQTMVDTLIFIKTDNYMSAYTVDNNVPINNAIEKITYIRTVFWTITYQIICNFLQASVNIALSSGSILYSYSGFQHRREGTVSLSQTAREEGRKWSVSAFI